MVKVKNIRSVDCVVGGFRYESGERLVGSLLLGLYDDKGILHHVGFTSGIREEDRRALTAKLEALRDKDGPEAGFTGRSPGGPSRWMTERTAEWEPLPPALVVEVSYDHFTGGRFRHGTRLLRWRPDKRPRQCSLDQVVEPQPRLIARAAARAGRQRRGIRRGRNRGLRDSEPSFDGQACGLKSCYRRLGAKADEIDEIRRRFVEKRRRFQANPCQTASPGLIS